MTPDDRATAREESLRVTGDFPVNYVYTVGVAAERFLREIKDNGRIMGAKCDRCGLLYLPPRMFCERCFSKVVEWAEVGSVGRIHTLTTCRIDVEGRKLDEPVIIAVIKFDGAHGALVHRLDELNGRDVKVGDAVRAVFKPIEERTGSILDIAYFKPT